MKTADGHEITVGMEVWIHMHGRALKATPMRTEPAMSELDFVGVARLDLPDGALVWMSTSDVYVSRIAALGAVIERHELYLRCANHELQEAEHEEYIKRKAMQLGFV